MYLVLPLPSPPVGVLPSSCPLAFLSVLCVVRVAVTSTVAKKRSAQIALACAFVRLWSFLDS